MNAEEAPVAMSQLGRSVKHHVAKLNDRLKMNTGVMNIIIHQSSLGDEVGHTRLI